MTVANGIVMKLDRRRLRLVRLISDHLREEPSLERHEWLGAVVGSLIQRRQTDYTVTELAWAVEIAESRRDRVQPMRTTRPTIVQFPIRNNQAANQ